MTKLRDKQLTKKPCTVARIAIRERAARHELSVRAKLEVLGIKTWQLRARHSKRWELVAG